MANTKLEVLVTGATGKQGGALARRLIAAGHSVRALTRKPDSAGAKALRGLGATIAVGDFADRASLARALDGVETVFAMSTPFEAGPGAETAQGKAIVDASREAKVQHFVFTSVASADKKTGIPHFESKYEVEQHLRGSGLPFTIVAPVYFMENLFAPWNIEGLGKGVYAMALPAGRKLQQVAVEDIGAFSAHVIAERDRFVGKRIDLASDELSNPELVEILSRVAGRPFQYVEVPLDAVRAQNEDFARMFEWFDKVGYTADIAGLRRELPNLGWHRFEDWARKQDFRAVLG